MHLLDEIKTAYQVHNLRPIRGCFLRDDFACPLVALAIHRGVVKKDEPIADGLALKWVVETFGEARVMGFIDGFDGHARKVADTKERRRKNKPERKFTWDSQFTIL